MSASKGELPSQAKTSSSSSSAPMTPSTTSFHKLLQTPSPATSLAASAMHPTLFLEATNVKHTRTQCQSASSCPTFTSPFLLPPKRLQCHLQLLCTIQGLPTGSKLLLTLFLETCQPWSSMSKLPGSGRATIWGRNQRILSRSLRVAVFKL